MRSAAMLALSASVALVPIPSQASSVDCLYMLLRVYHAELDHCQVALPKDQEDRYQRLRTSMESYIRANAKNDPQKIIASVDDNIRRAIAGLSSCRSNDFTLARQAMDQLTTPMNETNVRDRLKYPEDPQVGSCGT